MLGKSNGNWGMFPFGNFPKMQIMKFNPLPPKNRKEKSERNHKDQKIMNFFENL